LEVSTIFRDFATTAQHNYKSNEMNVQDFLAPLLSDIQPNHCTLNIHISLYFKVKRFVFVHHVTKGYQATQTLSLCPTPNSSSIKTTYVTINFYDQLGALSL
jgi:hypothetical protein